MTILIVDDNFLKISELSEFLNKNIDDVIITVSENVTNALYELNNYFDIAFIDLHIPIKIDDSVSDKGGEFLVREMYRKTVNIPRYIFGFSQYDVTNNFPEMWGIIRYDSSGGWKKSIKQIIKHVLFNKDKLVINNTDNNLPTIFVEGITDKYYLETAIKLFYPEKLDTFRIETQKSAGANWVINQLIAWYHSNLCSKKTKAIALLDSDYSGNEAKKNLQIIDAKNFDFIKVIQYKASYNNYILDFYKQSCKIEIEIETLFSPNIYELFVENNFTSPSHKCFLETPKNWDSLNLNLREFLNTIELKAHQCYLERINTTKKYEVIDFIKSNNLENKEAFENFKPLLDDIFNYLDE